MPTGKIPSVNQLEDRRSSVQAKLETSIDSKDSDNHPKRKMTVNFSRMSGMSLEE